MGVHLNCLAKEDRHLHSQSQVDGAMITTLSSQLQEVVDAMGTNGRTVGNNLVELSKRCDCQRKEINHLKDQEEWRGEVVGINHNLKLFEARLESTEEKRYRCGQTPSDVELISQEEVHSEFSYVDENKENKYFAPSEENLVPIPIPAPCCHGNSIATCPTLEEIVEEPREASCKDLDA